jgi:low affinity Fe/Cu permease
VSNGFPEALAIYKGMINFTGFNEILSFLSSRIYEVMILLLGIIICWFAPNSNELSDNFKPTYKNMIFAAALFYVALVQMTKVVQFLYFQF